MPPVIQTPVLAVPLAGGIDQGQIFRAAGFEKPCFQTEGNMLGKAGANESAGGNRIPVEDEIDRIFAGRHFAFSGCLRRHFL
jgi:hypothetical protein